MLGKRADDMTEEVVTSIDEGCGKLGVYRSDYQFLVIRNLLGNDFVDFDPLHFAKLFGGALGVPKNEHSERVHPVVDADLGFSGCLENLIPRGVWRVIIIIYKIFFDERKSVIGGVSFFLLQCKGRGPYNATTLTSLSLSQNMFRADTFNPGEKVTPFCPW
jgi:hypothetical protein